MTARVTERWEIECTMLQFCAVAIVAVFQIAIISCLCCFYFSTAVGGLCRNTTVLDIVITVPIAFLPSHFCRRKIGD